MTLPMLPLVLLLLGTRCLRHTQLQRARRKMQAGREKRRRRMHWVRAMRSPVCWRGLVNLPRTQVEKSVRPPFAACACCHACCRVAVVGVAAALQPLQLLPVRCALPPALPHAAPLPSMRNRRRRRCQRCSCVHAGSGAARRAAPMARAVPAMRSLHVPTSHHIHTEQINRADRNERVALHPSLSCVRLLAVVWRGPWEAWWKGRDEERSGKRKATARQGTTCTQI
jgi:hypothetical protein